MPLQEVSCMYLDRHDNDIRHMEEAFIAVTVIFVIALIIGSFLVDF
jgi:hypothetical protein